MLRTLQQRDKREGELDAIQNAIGGNDLKKERLEKYFKDRLEAYQVFKKEKNIEGVKY